MHNRIESLCQAARHRSVVCAMSLVLALAAFGIFFALLPVSYAYAAGQDATLTLQMQYEEGGTTVPIDGATATAYKVASLDSNTGQYTLVKEFSSTNADFNGSMSASEMQALATEMEEIVSAQNIEGITATSGSNGAAEFGVLDSGIYLLVQTGKADTAEQYNDFISFLVNVPQFNNGETTFDVVVYPKITKGPVPSVSTPSVAPSPGPKHAAPKTGDNINWQLWLSCLAIGSALVAIACTIRRRTHK